MLPSKFVSVLISDDGRSQIDSDSENTCASSDDASNNNIHNKLELTCKLPKVLLSECTISLASPESKKRDDRRLRFEATVIPVRLSSSDLMESDSESVSFEIEDALQGVQAVYSDDENNMGEIPDDEFLAAGSSNKCGVCGQVFVKWVQLECPLCGEKLIAVLLSVRSLVNHVRYHSCATDETSKGFTCQVCGKTYVHRSVLKKHAAVHTGYRQRCKVCGIDFTQRSSLLRHCKKIHGLKNDEEVEKAVASQQIPSMGKE